MPRQPIPYQILAWGENTTACKACPNPIYMDANSSFWAAMELGTFDNVNLLLFKYTSTPPFVFTPTADVKTVTRFNLTVSSGVYCYQKGAGNPYYATWSVPLATRVSGIGDINTDDYVKFSFNYQSEILTYAKLELVDNTTTNVIFEETITLEVVNTSTAVDYYFKPTTAPVGGYTLTLTIYPSSTAIAQSTFCMSDFTLYLLDQVKSISFTSCDEDVVPSDTLTFAATYWREYEIVEITPPFNEVSDEICGSLSLNIGQASRSTLSASYGVARVCFFNSLSSCTDLIKLDYTLPCAYIENLEYVTIPQQAYLKGYTSRLPLQNRERVSFVMPNGKLRTVYNSSYAKAQVKFGVYAIYTHEALERAAENAGFHINNQLYTLDDDSVYQIAELGSGLYTGRIDMIVDGSERIVSECCCPVENIDGDVCGSLIITDICGEYTDDVLTNVYIYYELDGIVNGTFIDARFENLTAISTAAPCSVVANTPTTILTVGEVGDLGNYVVITAADWNDHFDVNYCGVQDIQYALSIRARCDGFEDYGEQVIIVPGALPACE